MKFTKLSLVAALLAGSSAFAIDNVKVSGDAKLYYATSDQGADQDLFNKSQSIAQGAASLSISADLTKNVSAGTKVTALSTLGLEGQLVNNVWEGTNGVSDSYIVNELWMATTIGKTTGKIGRMPLDTPLVFTEKWSIVENTFEAAVVINQDIPDTTLVGAYVGGGNGQTVAGNEPALGAANVVQATNNETTFNQFHKGAYAAGLINNSFKPLTVQAWYFDAVADDILDPGTLHLHGVEAYWLQADLACKKIPGLMAGAQYTGATFQVDDTAGTRAEVDSSAYAVMLGYEMKDMATVKVAYSDVDKDHAAGFNLGATGQSKLYTEAFWGMNFNKVTQADTASYKVSVETPANGIADLGLYYTNANKSGGDAGDMEEIAVSASRTYGPLDTTLAYVNTKDNGGDRYNGVQAYLTLNF